MFERFDESARRALFFARYEATQQGSMSIEDGHLAAGILRELPRDEWRALGATQALEEIRNRLDRIPPDGRTGSVLAHIPFSAGTKRALQVAMDIADRHSHSAISSGHLLAAVIEADEGSATSRLLREAGVNPLRLAAAVTTRGLPDQDGRHWEVRLLAHVQPNPQQDDHDLRVICDTLFIATDGKDWTTARSVFADGPIDVDMTSLIGGTPVKITADQLIDGFRAGLHAGKTSHHLVANYLIAVNGDHADITAHGYAWNRVGALAPNDLWETWGTYRFIASRTPAGWRLNRFEYHSKLTRGNDAVRTHTIAGA
jgi:hypothetical protein